jgi:hypothetical protein
MNTRDLLRCTSGDKRLKLIAPTGRPERALSLRRDIERELLALPLYEQLRRALAVETMPCGGLP